MKVKKTFRLSTEYSVEFTVDTDPPRVDCAWSPDLPQRQLTDAELQAYRAARDEMTQKLAGHLGGGVIVLEI